MKARIRRTDASILLAHAYPDQMKQIEVRAGSMARVKAELMARADAAARLARIKMLKAQVDAGTYIVDSRAIAQKIQLLPILQKLTDCEKNATSLPRPEDELQE